VEAAGQAAFETAATAAAAAKAAIELSRAGFGGSDHRYRRTPGRSHADDEMLHRAEDLARSRLQARSSQDKQRTLALWQEQKFLHLVILLVVEPLQLYVADFSSSIWCM
jgi:hypothetical protein